MYSVNDEQLEKANWYEDFIDLSSCKVHIFWDGHKIFDWQYIGQIIGGDFEKFCGLLRIYEFYRINV